MTFIQLFTGAADPDRQYLTGSRSAAYSQKFDPDPTCYHIWIIWISLITGTTYKYDLRRYINIDAITNTSDVSYRYDTTKPMHFKSRMRICQQAMEGSATLLFSYPRAIKLARPLSSSSFYATKASTAGLQPCAAPTRPPSPLLSLFISL